MLDWLVIMMGNLICIIVKVEWSKEDLEWEVNIIVGYFIIIVKNEVVKRKERENEVKKWER